ncbi:hypothetical protein GCM10023153_10180 [Ornithinibacter aureus]|uniref:Uncharacterized protein n=1 Tax=Ornithinibacter aureus TaxID=622664 RepID=A0ABP8JJD8_9MICO
MGCQTLRQNQVADTELPQSQAHLEQHNTGEDRVDALEEVDQGVLPWASAKVTAAMNWTAFRLLKRKWPDTASIPGRAAGLEVGHAWRLISGCGCLVGPGVPSAAGGLSPAISNAWALRELNAFRGRDEPA